MNFCGYNLQGANNCCLKEFSLELISLMAMRSKFSLLKCGFSVHATMLLVEHSGHEEELEVFASDFANDVPLSVNYKAIDFFAHLGQNASAQVNPLHIQKLFKSWGSGVQNHIQLFCTVHCRDQGTLEA
nr:hypothetical protein CFP56_33077 [Quercus suber]